MSHSTPRGGVGNTTPAPSLQAARLAAARHDLNFFFVCGSGHTPFSVAIAAIQPTTGWSCRRAEALLEDLAATGESAFGIAPSGLITVNRGPAWTGGGAL